MFASSNNNCNNINATIKAMAINIYNCLRTQFNLLINFINTWALPRLINKENRKKMHTLVASRDFYFERKRLGRGGMRQNEAEWGKMRWNEAEWGGRKKRAKVERINREKNPQEIYEEFLRISCFIIHIIVANIFVYISNVYYSANVTIQCNSSVYFSKQNLVIFHLNLVKE